MNHGRIQQIGSPEEIYENPKNRFVAAFVGHTNLFDGQVVELRGQGSAIVECDGMAIPCRPTGDLAKGEKVTVALRYEKVGLATPNQDASQASFTGVVADRTYLGNAARLVTRIADRLTMTADITDIAQVRGLTVGDTVQLSFLAESAVAVPD